MVVPEEAVPSAFVEFFLPFLDDLFKFHKREWCKIPFLFSLLLVKENMFKLEYHGKFAAVRVAVEFGKFGGCTPGFAYCDQVAFLECGLAHFTDVVVKHRSVGCDFLVRLFCDLIDYVQTESAYAFFHPSVDHVK